MYGVPWEVCKAAMERSLWYEQQEQPPSWHSQDPASCANETYYTFTTYSTTEMLKAGEHTLWMGLVAMTSHTFGAGGWTK